MSNSLSPNERSAPVPAVGNEVYRAVFNTFDPHIAVLDHTGRIIAVKAAWEHFRASNTDAHHIRGMGIGLFVVNEIVALHGGEITVDSREGEGSTFRLYLPLITAASLS